MLTFFLLFIFQLWESSNLYLLYHHKSSKHSNLNLNSINSTILSNKEIISPRSLIFRILISRVKIGKTFIKSFKKKQMKTMKMIIYGHQNNKIKMKNKTKKMFKKFNKSFMIKQSQRSLSRFNLKAKLKGNNLKMESKFFMFKIPPTLE